MAARSNLAAPAAVGEPAAHYLPTGPAKYPRLLFLAAALLALLVSSVSFLTYNQFYGGADEGCYTTMGYQLAHGKGFMPVDPVMAYAATYTDPYAFLPDAYYVANVHTGRTKLPWTKGYPLLTAPLWRLFGYTGHRLWNPLAAGLTLVLGFLLLASMGLPGGGLVAALLLGTSWAFLWYARYPMSEMTSALFATLAAFLVVRYRIGGGRWHIWAAAVVVGYALWVHIANAALIVGFAIWVAWLARVDGTASQGSRSAVRLARPGALILVPLV